MTTTKIRRLTTAVAAPLIGAGMMMGGLTTAGAGTASAQPAADSQCSQMAMTNGQSGPNPSALTRAGMINAAAGPSASDGSMPANCAPAGHS